MKTADDFWQAVNIGRPDECWPWKLAQRKDGYGNVRWQGRMTLAHRVAFLLSYGHLPDETRTTPRHAKRPGRAALTAVVVIPHICIQEGTASWYGT